MKLIAICFLITCTKICLAQQPNSLLEKLKIVNSYWSVFGGNDYYYYLPTTLDVNSNDMLSTHLLLVEGRLRAAKPTLSKHQLKNRNHCLDILHTYALNAVFPINLYHKERRPYFIDHNNTACAVGHLMRETGYGYISQQIHDEDNYGYVKDLVLKYPALVQWANKFGFTADELAWIQPAYGPPNNGTVVWGNSTIIHQSQCFGSNGWFILDSNAYPNLVKPLIGKYGVPPFTSNVLSTDPIHPIGTFTVTITDAMFNTVYSVMMITQVNTLNTSIAQTSASCGAPCTASATVSVSNGFPPYAYSLDSITFSNDSVFHNLCAGTYTYYANDNIGCIEKDSFVVGPQSNLQASVQQLTPILCNGDTCTVVVNATGGVGSLSGSGSFQQLAGTYSYVVTDSLGCADTVAIALTQPAPLQLNVSYSAIPCFGYLSTVTSNAIGGTAPYTYSAACGANNTNFFYAGILDSMFVTDNNGCSDTNNITITEPAPISATATIQADYGSQDGSISVQVNGGTAPYTFDWSNDSTTQFIDSLGAGTYQLVVKDANGCSSNFSFVVPLNTPFSLTSNLSSGIRLSPNPSSTGRFTLFDERAESTLYHYSIYNCNGQFIKTGTIKNGSNIEVEPVKGFYFIYLTPSSGKTLLSKVSIQ